MGQYSLAQRQRLNTYLASETSADLENLIQKHVDGAKKVDLEQLKEQLPITVSDHKLVQLLRLMYGNIIIRIPLYHWYHELPSTLRTVDTNYLKETIEEKMRELGAKNSGSLFKKMKIGQNEAAVYQRWLSNDVNTTKTGVLNRFCWRFGVNPEILEEQKVFLDRKFPIPTSTRELAKLKTHVLNEGTMNYRRGKSSEMSYANKDPALLHYFITRLKQVGGHEGGLPTPAARVMRVSGDALTARLLNASGLPYGSKTKVNPALDPLVFTDPETRRYHVQATLTEEGWISLRVNRNRNIQMEVGWNRSTDITDRLTEEQRNALLKFRGETIFMGDIDSRETLTTILSHPHETLAQEKMAIVQSHSDEIPGDTWPQLRIKGIHVSKKGRVTVSWSFQTRRPILVELLCERYGMLPGTWKAERAEKLYRIYQEYLGKRLTPEEVVHVKRSVDETAKSVDQQQFINKMKTYFPQARWINDREKVGRVVEE